MAFLPCRIAPDSRIPFLPPSPYHKLWAALPPSRLLACLGASRRPGCSPPARRRRATRTRAPTAIHDPVLPVVVALPPKAALFWSPPKSHCSPVRLSLSIDLHPHHKQCSHRLLMHAIYIHTHTLSGTHAPEMSDPFSLQLGRRHGTYCLHPEGLKFFLPFLVCS